MRFILLIAVLGTLTACNGSSSKKSEKCTLNGSPIDCASLNGRGNTVTTPNRGGARVAAVVEVTGPIAVDYEAGEFEMLANAQERASADDGQGNTVDCEATLIAGAKTEFSQIGDRLFLSREGESMTLTRASAGGRGLNGEWLLNSDDGDTLSMTFTNDDTLTVKISCSI